MPGARVVLEDPLLQRVPEIEGYKILGGVVLYQRIGRGGMGTVYRGRHLRLNIDVAVKVMAEPQPVDPARRNEVVGRFKREAQTAAHVDHPGLIRVFDVDNEFGIHYIVMQHIEGETAGDRRERKGGLSEAEAVTICMHTAEALGEAHRRGVVHRDVKPDNILIDLQGRVRVGDLGLAKAIGNEIPASERTHTQMALGTPSYMAPEQFASSRDVGPPADVWSLGVTLYSLLANTLPWRDKSAYTLAAKIQSEEPPGLKELRPDVSDATLDVVARALSKDAADRFSDCGVMAQALRATLAAPADLADPGAGATRPALTAGFPPSHEVLTRLAEQHAAASRSGPGASSLAPTVSRMPADPQANGPATKDTVPYGMRLSRRRSMSVIALAAVGILAATIGAFVALYPGAGSGLPEGANDSLSELRRKGPQTASGAYVLRGDTFELELSEYAGYGGFIVANGGLAPSEDSYFWRTHGFKVHITLSEAEAVESINSGRLAASATTADVLPVYGRQLDQLVVPAQIAYSRGADGVVVRSGCGRINALKGKVLASCQFNEADFFLRYLAQEAEIGVEMLPDLNAPARADKVNIVYCPDAFLAGDLFMRDIREGWGVLDGCVTWAPKTTELLGESGNQARLLITTQNLLIVADILIVNRAFAQEHPDKVKGLVDGLLHGNRLLREDPQKHLPLVAESFDWGEDETREELGKIHFSNLPENITFFEGAMDAGGTFGGIYQSAYMAYGRDLTGDPADPDRFVELSHLRALREAGAYADERPCILPIRLAATGPVEPTPLLSRNIRFLFEANSTRLDLADASNTTNLQALIKLLTVSPGSTILLRGHVDGAMIPEFRQRGGEALVRQMSLKAVELSRGRAAEIKRVLTGKLKAAPDRVETVGLGWDEPLGEDNELNRRVEVQWFTVY
jgi:NitT/TauT family transport system substrate-binding protein